MGLQWDQFAFLLSVIAAWSLLIIAMIRWILSRSFKHYDDKLLAQEKATKKIESSFLEMKADLPLSYVRKEDFIRHEVVLNAKLDRLGDHIAYIRENMK